MSDNEEKSAVKRKRDVSASPKRDSSDSEKHEKRDDSRKNDRDYDRKRDYRDVNKRRRRSPDFDRRRRDDRNYHRRRDDWSSRRRDRSYERDDRDSHRRRDNRNLRRYWDTGDKNEGKFRDRFDSDDEVEVGERFYGGKRKQKTPEKDTGNEKRKENEPPANKKSQPEVHPSRKKNIDMLTTRTGGAYIPPARLKLMQAEISDKSGAAYQRIAWEALKKSIHGHINKVNTSNIGIIVRELLKENIVRGRGLLSRSIIQAQSASPTFTSVYAALTAVINSKFPDVGELILKRLLNQFKRGYRRNDKSICISAGTFISHLVNQGVVHDLLVLEILMLLTENPTDDSIEIAIAVLKEAGMKLTQTSKKGIECIFTSLRSILHEGALDKRVQYMIEVMFQIRKDGFKDHEAIPDGLDLVEDDDQITHFLEFEDKIDSQDILNVFKMDPDYVTSEEKYRNLIKEILDTDSSGSEDDGDEEESEEGSDEEEEGKQGIIIDNTETNLKALRRTIYLTIHSSLDFEECAHKLLKMQLKPGQEIELCHMILDCCAENRTYEKFFGLLAGRFCAIKQIYVTPFEQIFRDSYDTIYRLDTNKLRNVANFFAHLFCTDSISWEAMSCIKLNENDTNSSGRVFIKILFQKLSEDMSLAKLNERLKDPTLNEAFSGLFPRDDPRNTRFAINFFTTIGLGGLTDDLREHLESRPKTVPVPQITLEEESSSSETSSSSPSSSSSSSSSSSDSSDSGVSDSSEDKKRKKKLSKKRESGNKVSKAKKSKEENKDKKQKKKRKEKEVKKDREKSKKKRREKK